MYNCSGESWLESTYLAVGEGKVLLCTITKPWIFVLGIASKENFVAYSVQFTILIIRLVPGNVSMVAIGICRKSPITGEWTYGFMWLISRKAAGCMSAVLVEVGPFVGVSQVFCWFYYLLCEGLLWGNYTWWLLYNFKYTFHFNLTWKKHFLESTLRRWIFHK